MTTLDQEGILSGSRQVVLILRLALDRRSRPRHDELVDVDGVVQGRFRIPPGLLEVLGHWLEPQADDWTLAADAPCDLREVNQSLQAHSDISQTSGFHPSWPHRNLR